MIAKHVPMRVPHKRSMAELVRYLTELWVDKSTGAPAPQTRVDQISAVVRRQSLLVADADSADVGMIGALDAALEGIEAWTV